MGRWDYEDWDHVDSDEERDPNKPPYRDPIEKELLQEDICAAIDTIAEDYDHESSSDGDSQDFEDPCDFDDDCELSCDAKLHDSPEESKPMLISDKYPFLYDAFRRWKVVADALSPPSSTYHPVRWYSELIYVLDHAYTTSSFALDDLDPCEEQTVKTLADIGRELEFTVLLATTERLLKCNEVAYCERSETSLDRIEFKQVFDLEGNKLVSDWPTEEHCFLQADTFDVGRTPDEEEHEGYTGKDVGHDKFWFRNSVIVIVQNSRLVDFLTRDFFDSVSTDSAATLIAAWTKKHQDRPGGHLIKQQLRHFCDYVLNANLAPKISDNVLGIVVKASLALCDAAMMHKAIRRVKQRLPADAFAALLKGSDRLPPDELRQALEASIGGYATFHSLYDVVRKAFVQNFSAADNCTHVTRDWAFSALAARLEQKLQVNARDGQAVFELLWDACEQPEIAKRLTAAVGHLMEQGNFAITLLAMLCRDDTRMPHQLKHSTFEELLPLASLKILVPLPDTTPAPIRVRPPLRFRARCQPRKVTEPDAVEQELPNALAAIAYRCATSSTAEITGLFYAKLTNATFRTEPKLYGWTYMPTIRVLIPLIAEMTAEPQRSSLDKLILAMLENYVRRFVGNQPAQGDFSRRTVSCKCDDCKLLNAFLRHPQQQIARFSMGQRRRDHLRSALSPDSKHFTFDPDDSNVTKVKITKMDLHGMNNEAWRKRCKDVATELRSLRQDLLRKILGDAFERIVSMRDVVIDYARAPGLRAPLGKLPQNVVSVANPMATSMKRKAGEISGIRGDDEARKRPAPTIIDLCDED